MSHVLPEYGPVIVAGFESEVVRGWFVSLTDRKNWVCVEIYRC